eukprot:Gb_35334 [translate_table: standard]
MLQKTRACAFHGWFQSNGKKNLETPMTCTSCWNHQYKDTKLQVQSTLASMDPSIGLSVGSNNGSTKYHRGHAFSYTCKCHLRVNNHVGLEACHKSDLPKSNVFGCGNRIFSPHKKIPLGMLEEDGEEDVEQEGEPRRILLLASIFTSMASQGFLTDPPNNTTDMVPDDFLPLDIRSTWKAMEKCVELGLTKSIGVSNFSCKKIEDLLGYAKIPPAVNQVEMHPMWQQQKLREHCSKLHIHVSAWAPLGSPGKSWGSKLLLDSHVIQEIAQKYSKTTAQVALRWGIEQGVIVVPKTVNERRLHENFGIFDFQLIDEDHKIIGMLEQRKLFTGIEFVSPARGPYKTLDELWDGEI